MESIRTKIQSSPLPKLTASNTTHNSNKCTVGGWGSGCRHSPASVYTHFGQDEGSLCSHYPECSSNSLSTRSLQLSLAVDTTKRH